jgi:hypothetical protein
MVNTRRPNRNGQGNTSNNQTNNQNGDADNNPQLVQLIAM